MAQKAGMRWAGRGSGVLLCAALLSCSAEPPAPAKVALPAHYDGADWVMAQADASKPAGSWWQAWHDPVLDGLETRALRSNPTLAIASAQWDQARAEIDLAEAPWWPSISASAQASRGQTALGVGTSRGWGAQANWVPDLWGTIRWQVRQRKALAQAQQQLLAAAQLSLTAQVAQAYFALLAADQQQRLDSEMLTVNQKLLVMTQHQLDAGVVSTAALLLAQGNLAVSQQQVAHDRWQEQQLRHALTTLCGEAAGIETLTLPTRLPARLAVAPGLPATLLQRRPDVAAAERQVAAANAAVHVAELAWFPVLSLGANFSSSQLGYLRATPYRTWSIGPSLAQTLFAGGLRRAELAIARASYRQTAEQYRATILQAIQEAQDDWVAVQGLRQQEAAAQISLRTAQQTLQLTQHQYDAGTVAAANVLQARSNWLAQELLWRQLQAQDLNAEALLVQALGGIW